MFPLAAVAAAVVPYATLLFISTAAVGLVPDTQDHRLVPPAAAAFCKIYTEVR